MSKGSDALTGLILAFVGIGILLLWRSGALKRALGISAPADQGAPSIIQQITRMSAPDPASKLPSPPLAPVSLSPQGPGSIVATAGQVDNGYSSFYIGSPAWAQFVASERNLGAAPTGQSVALLGGGAGGALLSAV